MISRRGILGASAMFGGMATMPLAGLAQPISPTRAFSVGIIGPDEQPRFSELAAGLREGLAARGYPSERLALIEAPVARRDSAALERAIRRLQSENVAVVFAIGTEVARVVRRATANLPIVFITPGDPAAIGLIRSYAQPGANMTGVTFEYPELSGKRMELAHDLLSGPGRVLVIADPRDASPRQGLAMMHKVASNLAMVVAEQSLTSEAELPAAISALAANQVLLVVPGGAPSAHYAALIQAAHAARVMTVFPGRTRSTANALVTYGAKDVDVARDATRLIAQILEGTNAGDIPVERPTRMDLIVNLKTAKALGVTVPPSLLLRADHVIE
jgi:putative tryptophan/tyrosine transport system substrate-binding protein